MAVRFWIVALCLALCPLGTTQAAVTTTSQTFGAVRYSEEVDESDVPRLHQPRRIIHLRVTSSMLSIADRGRSLSIDIKGPRCDASRSVSRYADVEGQEALTRSINTTVLELLRLCPFSTAQVGEERQTLLDGIDDLAAAVAHMRQRAIVLTGSDQRCENRPPPPKLRKGEPPPPPTLNLGALPDCAGVWTVTFE